MSDINELLPHLSDEYRAHHLKAIGLIFDAFTELTTIEVDPTLIENLSAVREHVLSGGQIALDIEAATTELKADPSISAKLIAAEVEAAEINKIQTDTASMSRQERMNYAREHGLDRPRSDSSNMTLSEHLSVLSSLSPMQRIAYARRHGIS